MTDPKIEAAVANFRSFLEAASNPEHNEKYLDRIEEAMRTYAETLDDDTKLLYLTRGIAAIEYLRAELKEARGGS